MDTSATARPIRADVAASYDRGVDGYINVWSAVILPPAQAVVAALNLLRTATVVDVGAGSGALVPSIKQAAPDGVVVAVDASLEMLRAARDRTGALVAHVDASELAVREASADAVLLAFVLFHLSDPGQALGEAFRVLRPGGKVGTVTWASESTLPAYTVWDQTLSDAGALPLTPRRVDTDLDSPEAMSGMLRAAGFGPTRVWTETLSHQWTPDTYWQLATGSGLNRLRLERLDDEMRADTLTVARQRLAALQPRDFAWTGTVVCSVATRPRPGQGQA
jgi:ubiquinone/menaquinone biosynthesis C-methylase UbiE